VHCVRSRGNDYYYFQPSRGYAGEKIRVALPGDPRNRDGTPNDEWWAAYRKCMGEPAKTARAGTFAALIEDYRASPEWRELSAASQRDYGRYLDEIGRLWGKLMVAGVEAKHVLALRDAKAATPAGANYLIRTLSAAISWGIPRGYRANNPCLHVRKLKIGKGYSPWTWEQIAHFRENVSKPEMWHAAALALYSGQRQADNLSMMWSDAAGEVMSVVQEKTGEKLRIPMHRDLRGVLSGIPRRATTILTNTKGLPWTSDGFRASWGKELARPAMEPLRGLVFHGLRKSAVVFLLEAGSTDAEVSSITGQSRQMVEHYAREVNQNKLAAAAVLKWEAATGTGPERSM
jgi:integrase